MCVIILYIIIYSSYSMFSNNDMCLILFTVLGKCDWLSPVFPDNNREYLVDDASGIRGRIERWRPVGRGPKVRATTAAAAVNADENYSADVDVPY